MSGWSDEIQTCVDTEIDLVNTAGLLLLQHIRFMLIVQELDNRHPRIAIVDIVSKSRCINNGQTDFAMSVICHSTYTINVRTFEELLLELSLRDFNLDGLVDLLCMSALVVRVILDRR